MTETYTKEFTPEDFEQATFQPKLCIVNDIFNEYWKHPEPPRIIGLSLGEQGSGKSAFSMKWLEKCHEVWDMKVAFLMMPKRFKEFIKNPRKFKPDYDGPELDWFYSVNSIKEVKIDDYMYNDEAAFLKQSNAKMAHTGEAMDLERMLMLCRQNHIPTLVCTQRPLGALAAIRDSTSIFIFKRMSTGITLLERNLPPIFTGYGQNLGTLRDNEAIILSLSTKYMNLNKYGGLAKVTDLEITDWWCPYVSEMWQGEQFDDTIDVEKYATAAFDAGIEIRTQLQRYAVRYWLRKNFPNERLTSANMSLIIDALAHFTITAEKEAEKKVTDVVIPNADGKEWRQWALELLNADILVGNYKLQPEDYQIMKLHYEDLDQGEIGKKLGKAQSTISKQIGKLNMKIIGLYYEMWFRQIHGDTRGILRKATEGIPDCVDNQGKVYQVKHADDVGRTSGFNVFKEATPEIEYCRNKGLPLFTFHFHNDAWANPDRNEIIDMQNIPSTVNFNEFNT